MNNEDLEGFYIVTVISDSGMNEISVGIVYGETQEKAKTKAINLFKNTPYHTFKMKPLELNTVKVTATLGGMVPVHEEFYYE